jgi:hypothetical protein
MLAIELTPTYRTWMVQKTCVPPYVPRVIAGVSGILGFTARTIIFERPHPTSTNPASQSLEKITAVNLCIFLISAARTTRLCLLRRHPLCRSCSSWHEGETPLRPTYSHQSQWLHRLWLNMYRWTFCPANSHARPPTDGLRS